MAVVAVLLTLPSAAAGFQHVIAPGESLSSVAAIDGLSVGQLAAANGLSPEASLIAGSSLTIPPQSAEGSEASAGSASTETAASAGSETPEGTETSESGEPEAGTTSAQTSIPNSGAGSYVVQPGDTLSQIAARAGASVEELAALQSRFAGE